MSKSAETHSKLNAVDFAFAGGFSGIISTFLCQPLDVIKIRFQLQLEPISSRVPTAKYRGISHALQKIVREEGFTALWKGTVPAQVLSVTFGVSQFTAFEVMGKTISDKVQHSPIVQFTSGAAAGIFATIVSFPFDVLRTRLVAQGEPKIYSGSIDAIKKIYTRESPRGFFRGLSPQLMQVAPNTGASFLVYSLLKDLWRKIANDEAVNTSKSVVAPVSVTGSLVCGSLTGMITKALFYPLDLMRKRLQVQGFEEARKRFGKKHLSALFTKLLPFWPKIPSINKMIKK